MVPIEDLAQPPTTKYEIDPNTYNKHLSFPADVSGLNPSSAGIIQQTTTVSSSNSHGFGVY